ncbi:MAG: sodium-dependent transporter, partial [Verrucomicrobia bacterium]|nr:sodium-dependent transporter [Verrucomicrobiota bacterium]
YCGSTARGKFMGLDPAGISGEFGKLCSDPFTMAVYMIAVVALGFFICSFSLSGGLERVTKYMMLALLGIMVMLAVNSVMMKGAGEGLAFYLKPDFSKINGSVIVSAINQAFFTLSLGIGSMAIFGSYLDKTHSLLGESVNVIVLDTFAAIVSGLIIFPACFTYGVSPNSGPSLIFETLPNIFNHMPLGRLWGMLFFVFMSFAALSTVLAVFENIISCCRDLTGWSRGKACLVNSVVLSLLSMPCVLGFNCWSRVKIAGLDIMGMEDFLVSNCLLPLGALIFVLFVTWRNGWGWKNFMAEANTGRGWKVQNWMRGYITYILPLIIFSLLVMGIISVFK